MILTELCSTYVLSLVQKELCRSFHPSCKQVRKHSSGTVRLWYRVLRDRPALTPCPQGPSALTPRGRLCHRVLQGATALVFMYLQVSAHLRPRRTRSAGINRSVRQTVSRNNWSVSRTDRRMVYSGGIYLRFWTQSTIHYSSLK